MTTEKHDPWALLREAREDLALAHADLDALRQTRKMSTLTDRIDAALAEHDAVPPSGEQVDSARPFVEWETDAFGNDYVKQGNVLSMVVQTLDGNWGWETRVEGYADTEAEAQRAALLAARGMR